MIYRKETIDWLDEQIDGLCRFWFIYNKIWPEKSNEDRWAFQIWEDLLQPYIGGLQRRKAMRQILKQMPKTDRKIFDIAVLKARLTL